MIIDPLFGTTKLSDEGLDKSTRISEAFSRLLYTLGDLLPGNNRELAAVKTKLEEASFFAKKALKHYERNIAQ